MKVQQAYAVWSLTYDQERNLTRDLDELVTQQTLAGRHFNSILELGCGTGKNTSLLAEIGKTVVALDFSEAMIAKARAKSRDQNVTFKLADINQRWPEEDQSADLVTCNLVLEHVAGLSFIFGEAARVLTAGGEVFVSELHPFRQYLGVQAHFMRENQPTHIPAFVHHVSEFIEAAEVNNLRLSQLNEWWHDEDKGKPPRLVSFRFKKST